MYPDDEHVAPPRLYGAPAYARPPVQVTPTALPPDLDDLPIAVYQTPEERAIAEELRANPFGVAAQTAAADPAPEPHPQAPRLGGLAGKLLGRTP